MQIKRYISIALSIVLVNCGGGGGSSSTAAKSSDLAQICAAGNYYASYATSSTKIGTVEDEKKWVKAYLDERYLWYRDMAAVDSTASSFNQTSPISSVVAYFFALLNPNKTLTGQYVDQFSFMTSTYAWNNQIAGQDLDYGWMVSQQGSGSSRRIFVNYVYPTTASGTAYVSGVLRGDEIISIDGVSATDTTNASVFNSKLSPSTSDTHNFVFARTGSNQITKTLLAATVALPQAEYKTVVDNLGTRWGYLLFNSHVQGVEALLTQAMTSFATQNVTELVVDLRYNGGGYLNIANALAYAIAGQQRAGGKIFESTRFNDKRSDENYDLLFRNTTLFGNQTYATLNLAKIYVLTSNDTCSASESLINGLRGIDVTVEIIGDTTCGKPYGFYAQDNCGLTYAAMEFEGVNAKGQGGYSEGLAPTCAASDDLTHQLGDPAESMFAKAISRQRGEACAASALALSANSKFKSTLANDSLKLIRDDWKKNKYLSAPN